MAAKPEAGDIAEDFSYIPDRIDIQIHNPKPPNPNPL